MAASEKDTTHLQTVNEATEQLDDIRVESLETVLSLKQDMSVEMKLEMERLVSKYGKGHSRVTFMQERVDSNEFAIQTLKIQSNLSRIKTDQFDPSWWRVQGFVSNEDGTPMKNQVVSLTGGTRSKSAANLGSSLTDETGFYTITIKEKLPATKSLERVFLQVSDKSKRNKFTYQKPLAITPGMIDIEDIIVPAK